MRAVSCMRAWRRGPTRSIFSAVILLLLWSLCERCSTVFAVQPRGAVFLRRNLRVERRCADSTPTGADDSCDDDEPCQIFALPASTETPKDQAGASGNADVGGKQASLQLPLSDKFGLAYTCGRCETRNLVEISRVAWNSGVVVATCRGCGARHLLADQGGLLDLTNDTGFTNVVQFIESRGDTITQLDRNDAEALKNLNLTLGENGKLRLAEEELVSSGTPPPAAFAPAPAPATAPAQAPAPQPMPANADSGVTEDVDVPPLVFELPSGAGQGDVLQVRSPDFGLLFVPVPAESSEGCRLEVQGMVTIGLGDHERWVQPSGTGEWEKSDRWKVGDIVAVNMPEGAVARIPIPESAAYDPTLQIGYPVVVRSSRT